jgi:hypothetical protein
MRSSARLLPALVLLVLVAPVACRRRVAPPPRPAPRPAPAAPAPVDSAVSDVATGGSWQEGGQSGVFRVVVRSGGRRNLRSEVVLQWLKWDDRAEQPVEVRSVVIRELSRGGVIVTGTRIDQDDGRTLVKMSVANAVTGASGEARVWPLGLGRYRAKLKWVEGRTGGTSLPKHARPARAGEEPAEA